MNTETVKGELKSFLNSTKPEIYVIKGSWGVGKTKFWNLFLESCQLENVITSQHYSYVSLFGINSLQELRQNLTESRTPIDNLNAGKNWKTLATNVMEALKNPGDQTEQSFFHTSWNSVKSLSKKGVNKNARTVAKAFTPMFELTSAYDALAFRLVNNCLICFDDLERKGQALDYSDVCGLASYLKEEANCKILFIYNENAIDEKHQESFGRYREKVVDLEISFNPPLEDIYTIAFTDSSANPNLVKYLKKYCRKKSLKNIRIIFKINRFCEKLTTHLPSDVDQLFLNHIAAKIVFYFWCNFDHENNSIERSGFKINITEIEDLRNGSYILSVLDAADDKIDEGKRKLGDKKNQAFIDYGLPGANTFDEVLISYLQNGLFNENKFKNSISKITKKLINDHEKGAFNDIRDLYFHTIGNVQNEIIELIIARSKTGIQYWSKQEIFFAVHILEIMKEDEILKNLVDQYVHHNQNSRIVFNLKSDFPNDFIPENKYLRKTFNDNHQKNCPTLSINEILTNSFKNQHFKKEFISTLEKATIEDFYTFFSEYKNDGIKSKLEMFISHIRVNKTILATLKQTFEKLAEESNLQKEKLDKYIQNLEKDINGLTQELGITSGKELGKKIAETKET